jgi:hypothetical protein
LNEQLKSIAKAATRTGDHMARLTYDKDITALLVIDPYNEFISDGGKVWDRPAIPTLMPQRYPEAKTTN